jgi:hypothetical protein
MLEIEQAKGQNKEDGTQPANARQSADPVTILGLGGNRTEGKIGAGLWPVFARTG